MKNKETLLQLPGIITKVEAMSKGAVKVVFTSQEAITADVRAKVMLMHEQYGWWTYTLKDQIEIEDIMDLPEIQLEKGELSATDRLNKVMYAYFLQVKKGNKSDFNQWRRDYLNKISDSFKAKME